MAVDVPAALQFIESHARLLERHLAALAFEQSATGPIVSVLTGYQNPDGGFGHALEPDIRCPGSQPAATLAALGVLTEMADDPAAAAIAARAVDWVARIANDDGGLPTVLPSADGHPRAPWMQPNDASGFLTYGIAARLWQLGIDHPWLSAGTEWCWKRTESGSELAGYEVKFALEFLDSVPDPARAAAGVERCQGAIRPDGTIPVEGGVEDEKIAPLVLSPRPGTPSRALFSDEQIAVELDRLEHEQQADGGWEFDFLHWSPAQAVEWRGLVTLGALQTLRTHDRL